MLEGALYEEEATIEGDREDSVSEGPWGASWGVSYQHQPEWDEEEGEWTWLLTAEADAGEGVEPDSVTGGAGLPALRPTALVRPDGERFRVPGGGLYCGPGWRSKMLPCRTTNWGYLVPAHRDNLNDGSDSSAPVTPVTPIVRIDQPTVIGPAGREVALPDASIHHRPLGDLTGRLPRPVHSSDPGPGTCALGVRDSKARHGTRGSLRGNRSGAAAAQLPRGAAATSESDAEATLPPPPDFRGADSPGGGQLPGGGSQLEAAEDAGSNKTLNRPQAPQAEQANPSPPPARSPAAVGALGRQRSSAKQLSSIDLFAGSGPQAGSGAQRNSCLALTYLPAAGLRPAAELSGLIESGHTELAARHGAGMLKRVQRAQP